MTSFSPIRSRITRPILSLALVLLSVWPVARAAKGPPTEGSFYVDYRSVVPAAKAGAFPLAILHPEAKTDLAAIRRNGTVVLAYLSIGEMAADAPYRSKARGLPLLGHNDDWNSDIIDLRDPRWASLLTDEIATPALRRGFDGFFLDTPDTLLAKAAADTPDGKGIRDALTAFIRSLHAKNPAKRIIINRGFELLPTLRGIVDGVMTESVFSSFDAKTGKCVPVAKEDTDELLRLLHGFARQGFAVHVLDYTDRNDKRGAFDVAGRIRAEGFHAFVTTPDLMGTCLAPWRDESRRVLTFYNLGGNCEWPEDSYAAKCLQLPLEWLGYDCDFVKVGDSLDYPRNKDPYAAVVIPMDFHVPPGSEKAFVDGLLQARRDGSKLIFFEGGDMIADENQRNRLFDSLGIGSSCQMTPTRHEFKITRNRIPGTEAPPPKEIASPLPLAVAPDGASVLIECDVPDAPSGISKIQPVFTCDWGGMALDPFILQERPDYIQYWCIDPFAFLEACLGEKRIPVTDATTADGLRVFISHIDGDGFANKSETRPDTFTGEIIRDRVLSRYPLPVSVSVIEAEVRGIARGLDEKNAPRLEDVARSIFRLPNIEVASHAYTHPFIWMKNDSTSGSYSEENLQLKFPYEMSLEREIGGSISYINERLAPKDKPVRLFLWTGNCRPGPEALRLVREAGIESLNGGDTLISKLSPSINAAASRSIPWDDELQVRAPMQNENVYTHLFTSKIRGSFIRLLQTFEMTENPRRLKAANLYYHFYSGDRADSLKAIESVCAWAMRTPLHPMVESVYAKTVRDAEGSLLFRDAGGRTLISGTGDCRTLRVPVTAGAPDFSRSSGVTGYADKGDERYVSLENSPVRILALAPGPGAHAHLETCEADTDGLVLEPRHIAFTTRAWRPSPVVIAGLPPKRAGKLAIDGVTTGIASDPDGKYAFTASPGSHIDIDFR